MGVRVGVGRAEVERGEGETQGVRGRDLGRESEKQGGRGRDLWRERHRG